MGIWEWTSQNWFNLLSGIGIVGSLLFTAQSSRSDTNTRRISNLLSITANQREVWKEFSKNPALARVLDSSADLAKVPVTHTEEIFVGMVISHIHVVYYSTKNGLLMELEGLQRDVSEFLALPIPGSVWSRSKDFQNKEFAAFVESCRQSN